MFEYEQNKYIYIYIDIYSIYDIKVYLQKNGNKIKK